MAEVQMLGLFHEVAATADAIAKLRELGVPDEKITVMSGIPIKPELLGRRPTRTILPRFTLSGTVLGFILAALLTFGMFLAYRLNQGGQGVTPIPPTLIVFFEVGMLGTMGITFLGLFVVNRFPVLRPAAYDPEITEGAIGLLVHVEAERLNQVEALLTAQGAHRCRRIELGPTGRREMWFWTVVGVVVVMALAAGVVFPYDLIKIPFPTNMVDQASVDFQQGPRLAAPAGAVPIQGPDLIGGQPASQPHAATSQSLQRGKILFDINCALCHGPAGAGDGKISAYFVSVPPPADLTSQKVQSLTDAEIFVIITQGLGSMPSLAENLPREDRWDVVNYVRQLKK